MQHEELLILRDAVDNLEKQLADENDLEKQIVDLKKQLVDKDKMMAKLLATNKKLLGSKR